MRTLKRPLMRLLSLMILLAVGINGNAQTKDALQLWLDDGTITVYALSEKPVLSFSDGKMNIATSSLSTSYPLADIKLYKFIEVPVGIQSPTNEEQQPVQVLHDGSDIVIKGLHGSAVLYDAAGHQLAKAAGQPARFTLSGLPAGVYILNMNGQTIKLVKQ